MKKLALSLLVGLSAWVVQADVTMEKVNFAGWPNCVRLSNGKVELVATTDVGPRILRFSVIGMDSVFKVWPEQLGKKEGEQWNIFGGHRFWHAPEDKVRTYQPDNSPVEMEWKDGVLKLVQKVEPMTGMQKEIEITMHPKDARVEVKHRLRNQNLWAVEAAPWALSVMQGPGKAILPQEPVSNNLLPARPMAMWGYTDMKDARWTWGTRFIQLQCDPAAKKPQKLGIRNSLGWMAYQGKDCLFVKRMPYDANATYPDYGCNTEVYTNGDMLEMETVGALTKISPGSTVEHTEVWLLLKYQAGKDEAEMMDKLMPVVNGLK